VTNNHFSGHLPALAPFVATARFNNNSFSGPLTPFPDSLTTFEASDNYLEGSISSLYLSDITRLALANNKLTGAPQAPAFLRACPRARRPKAPGRRPRRPRSAACSSPGPVAPPPQARCPRSG
jgi:hypothetical protein